MGIEFKNRSAQSKMLLVISISTAFVIIPFAIFRFINNDWYVAILDIVVAIGMLALYFYVYFTDDVKNASLVLILLALIANVTSFYIKGISQINWIYPAMLCAYYVMSPMKGMIVNFIMLSFYIPKLISLLEVVDIATVLFTVLVTNIIAYVFASGLRSQEIELKKLASEDYLTRTENRRALNDKMKSIYKTLKNHDKVASIILLDLDHFKKVNDKYGHIKGDEVLVRIADLLFCYFTKNSFIYRYGGEEFLILCLDKTKEEANLMADEFRKNVKNSLINDEVDLTISLGVAEYIKEESVDDWIHRVDLALYQAKNEGRDRVVQA